MIGFVLFLAVAFIVLYAVGVTVSTFCRWVWRMIAAEPYRDPDALAEAKRRNPWGG